MAKPFAARRKSGWRSRRDGVEQPLLVLVYPQDRNPYQDDLAAGMEPSGITTSYVGRLTHSASLNLALLPFEVIARRVRGARILHVHWVFPFALPWAQMGPLRFFLQLWFGATLWAARFAGLRLVWTAHNLLPHERVFWNDVQARRWLIRHAKVVIAHNDAARAELARMGAATKTVVIPLGVRLTPPGDVAQARESRDDHIRLLFFGNVQPYKGVEDLVEAMQRLDPAVPLHLRVVGECPDSRLAAQLQGTAGERISVELRRLTEDELEAELSAAAAVVLPFRAVTTSSSVVSAMSRGRPVVLPDLPALRDIPTDSCLRYTPTPTTTASGLNDLPAGLQQALEAVAKADRDQLEAIGQRGRRYVEQFGWDIVSQRTARLYRSLLLPAKTSGGAGNA